MDNTFFKEKLDGLLSLAAKENASDLHFAVGRRPTLRLDGRLTTLTKEEVFTKEVVEGMVYTLVPESRREQFLKDRELDFSYSYMDQARFRVNVYFQRGNMAAALRLIPFKIRTLEELNMPPVLHDFTRPSQGFMLVVGPAGHGKSTTLAAMTDEINHNKTDHIITIEDPIEYVFSQDRCIIDQREVASDTPSFHRALRSVLRQDPDVIMIGEMRDAETIQTAITAAETGHLVFSTLHTNSASQTLDRIIDSFPAAQQNQIKSQLASTLMGIISQRLIPRLSGGRIPACEVMITNSAIRNLIREDKIYQIDLVIETGIQEKMISLNRSLANLVRQGEISLESAQMYSLNPAELGSLLARQIHPVK
jgi:twitching motility protein PilT